MTTANKLTLLRMALIPVFLGVLYAGFPGCRYWALGVFIIASLTDTLDGYIARHYNQITNFGKFMDPLADKLLVCSALICLTVVQNDQLPTWIVLLIIAREFIISGFRLVASDNGIVIAASYWGKFKTVSHMAMIIMLILDFQNPVYYVLTQIVVWVGLALTVISLADYVWKNKQVLTQGGM